MVIRVRGQSLPARTMIRPQTQARSHPEETEDERRYLRSVLRDARTLFGVAVTNFNFLFTTPHGRGFALPLEAFNENDRMGTRAWCGDLRGELRG
jgi:hypothetical protein